MAHSLDLEHDLFPTIVGRVLQILHNGGRTDIHTADFGTGKELWLSKPRGWATVSRSALMWPPRFWGSMADTLSAGHSTLTWSQLSPSPARSRSTCALKCSRAGLTCCRQATAGCELDALKVNPIIELDKDSYITTTLAGQHLYVS